MRPKDIFILRAVSGSGKSALAASLSQHDDCVTVCADDFFTRQDGSYHFDVNLLGRAHKNCQWQFLQYLKDEKVNQIVVANTNTTAKDFNFYKKEAEAQGHRVFFLVVENRHGGKDVHNVPEDVKQSQAERIRRTLSL